MRPFFRLLLLTVFIAMTLSQCIKKTDDLQLPPETITGAMTFGCKINGKVFVPRDGRGKPGLIVQYAYLDGGWHLNIPATNWVLNPPEGVNIETDSLLVEEGKTYRLDNKKGSARAFYSKGNVYAKMDSDLGELHITKHDRLNRILAGTFFFIGTNTSSSSGEKVSITDGRFDIRY
jgi:hypothetical protein